MKLQKDLREFIELLNSTGVEYLIVGGYAVAFHGHPRFTADIDVFVEVSPASSDKLAQVIERFGFGSTGLSAKDFARPGAIIQLGHPPNRIDIVTAIDGVSFAEAWASRVAGDLDGIPVHFISKEALIRNKRASGRARDLADLQELE